MMELRHMLDQEFQLPVTIAFARLVCAADEARGKFRQDPGHVLGPCRRGGNQKASRLGGAQQAEQDGPDQSPHRGQITCFMAGRPALWRNRWARASAAAAPSIAATTPRRPES